MHRITKLWFASLVFVGTSQGCGNARPEPEPTLAPKSENTTAAGEKSIAARLPDRCPPDILKRIDSEDPKVRREAGRLLGILLQRSWQTPLVQGSETPDGRSQLQADLMGKIAKLGPVATEALSALDEILKQEAPLELKQKVLELLPQLEVANRQLGPSLAQACQHPKLQSAAVRLLVQLGCNDPESVAALGDALQNSELTSISLVGLNKLEGQQVVPASRRLMEVVGSKDQPVEIRIAAIEVIGKLSRPGAPDLSQFYRDDLPAIRKASLKLGFSDGNILVQESDPDVLAAAFEGLARPPIQATNLAQVFAQALKKESLRGRVNQFLKEHPDQVVGTLLLLFKSDSAMIRDYSIDLFAALSNDAPFDADLRSTLHKSDDPGLQALAAIKLGEVPQDADLNELAERTGKWISHPKLKGSVLALLSKIGASSVPTLAQLAVDSRLDSETRLSLLGVLAAQADAVTVAEPLLKEALASDAVSTRHWAAVALTKLTRDETPEFESAVTPILKDALKSPDPVVIQATLAAVSEKPKLGAGISADILATLTHAEAKVRISAIQNLAKIGPALKLPGILEALKKMAADDSNVEARKQAEDAIKQFDQK
ncbi:MAG: hypothetical protein JWM11_3705 [Planctomycetaceae bacterium]|nr:hypothetical protein [Planctomycetaceae bacterium]